MGGDYGEPVFVYTRAEAIADGVLVEVPAQLASEAGQNGAVALTAALEAIVQPTDDEKSGGQSYEGRLWDVLWMARFSRNAIIDSPRLVRMRFPVIFWMQRPDYRRGRAGQVTMHVDVVYSPDEHGNPTATFMLKEED